MNKLVNPSAKRCTDSSTPLQDSPHRGPLPYACTDINTYPSLAGHSILVARRVREQCNLREKKEICQRCEGRTTIGKERRQIRGARVEAETNERRGGTGENTYFKATRQKYMYGRAQQCREKCHTSSPPQLKQNSPYPSRPSSVHQAINSYVSDEHPTPRATP